MYISIDNILNIFFLLFSFIGLVAFGLFIYKYFSQKKNYLLLIFAFLMYAIAFLLISIKSFLVNDLILFWLFILLFLILAGLSIILANKYKYYTNKT